MRVYRVDYAGSLQRRPEVTPEGYLRCDATIARTGILEYADLNGKVKREYRPEEEVAHLDSLASFGGKILTLEHPPELLTAENSNKYAVGFTDSTVYYDKGFVKVAVTVTEKDAIERLNRGECVEVSAGYEVDLDEIPGTTPDGQKYDAIQRNIRGNHVCLTREGRAGKSVKVHLDSAGIPAAAQQNQKGRNMATLNLDSISFELPDNAAYAISERIRRDGENMEEMQEKMDVMSGELEEKQAAYDALKKKCDEMEAELEQLKADRKDEEDLEEEEVVEPEMEEAEAEADLDVAEEELIEKSDSLISSRFKIVENALSILGSDYEWEGKSNRQIKIDCLKSAYNGEYGQMSNAYVNARFDALVEGSISSTDPLKAAIGNVTSASPVRSDSSGLLQSPLPKQHNSFALSK